MPDDVPSIPPRKCLGALVLVALAVFSGGLCAQTARFLTPQEAFAVSAVNVPGREVRIDFLVQPGHYLYRDKTSITASRTDRELFGEVRLGPGTKIDDPYFGQVLIWRDRGQATVGFVSAGSTRRTVPLTVRYQGCAEAGLCYPPTTTVLNVVVPAALASSASPGTASHADMERAPRRLSAWSPVASIVTGIVSLLVLGWGYIRLRSAHKLHQERSHVSSD